MGTDGHFGARPATRGQLRDLAVALARYGLESREECLTYCAVAVGRPIKSRKDLSTREASSILDALEEGRQP
ncbi:MAG: hypothetical protein ABSE77_09265 [Acidimicrobiales bacterium]